MITLEEKEEEKHTNKHAFVIFLLEKKRCKFAYFCR